MLGEKLKQLREEKGVSQKEVADYLGISASGYGYYEQNQREPDVEKFKKLADYFNVSIDYLMGISNEKLTIYFKNGTTSEGLNAIYEIPNDAERISLINLINSIREKHGLPKIEVK